MHRTILATAVMLAFAGTTYAASIIASDTTVEFGSEGFKDKTVAYANDSITGTNSPTLTIIGQWANAIAATTDNVTVSGLKALVININNVENVNYGVNALYASSGKTLNVESTGSVSITTSGNQTTPKLQSPIPVHAMGGTVKMDVTGNIELNSDTNVIMSQKSGGNSGEVSLEAAGDITLNSVKGTSSAVVVGALSKSEGTGSIKLKAQNVTVTGRDAFLVYDSDGKWGGNAGTLSVDVTAADSLNITAERYGIYQLRKESASNNTTSFNVTAGNTVAINAGASAIRMEENGQGQSNSLNISAQNVQLVSDGETVEVQGPGSTTEKKTFATLSVGNKSSINFFRNGEEGAEQVNVTITNNGGGDAVSIANGGEVAAKNATLNIARGDIAAQGGTMNLTNTRLELGEGVTMNLGTLEGSNNTVVLNSIAEEGKTVTITSITSGAEGVSNLVAGGTLNDKYADASQLKEAMENAVSLTSNGQPVIPIYSGEAGAAAGAWTENEDGSITREANKGLEAFKEFNSATFAQWRAENNHLSQRLGDLRGNMGKAGAWARVYGTDAEISENVSVDLKTVSIQVGGDVTVGNNWVVGGAFTYTNMDGDISNGAADSDSYSLAAYAFGFFDCGGYIDVIGRVGRLSTDVTGDTGSVAGGVFDGSYDNTAFGLSVEVGYHWNVTSMFYVEPQVELAYGFVSGDDFTSSNGANVEQDDFQSLVGRLGARFGANFADNKGSVYMHASVNHDFLGDVDATAGVDGGARFDISNDLGGTWVSYGVGAQFNTSANMSFYGMLERANGSEYTEHYRYSVGMRYTF